MPATTTNAALGGDTFTLDTENGALRWGDGVAWLLGSEIEQARMAVEQDQLATLRSLFSSARGSF